MKGFYRLPSIAFVGFFLLLGTASLPLAPTIAQNQPASETVLSQEKLRQLARSLTVKVYAGDSRGSGIMTGKNGQLYTVITNAHVVDRGETYRIQTPDGKIYQATLKAKGDSFSATDLAILQFQSPDNYPIVKSYKLQASPNEPVLAAGFPEEGEQLAFSEGKISLIADKPLAGGYQIGFTNKIQQGMSGGLLLTAKGETIGVLGQGNLAIVDNAYTYQDGSRPNEQAIAQMRQSSFAIPLTSAVKLATNTVVAQIDAIAQKTTVRIDSAKSGNGSGVIVAKDGNTYYVLTASHVVKNPDQYIVVAPDGDRYPIDSATIKNFEGVDLAVLAFTAQKFYSVATLANYSLASAESISIAYIGQQLKRESTQGAMVFLSGFPGSDRSQRKLTAGNIVPQDLSLLATKDTSSLTQGYELVYSNFSQPGMSGGPLFDHFGRVIGINAAVEGEVEVQPQSGQVSEIYLGRSLGVPIRTFLGLAPQANLNPKLLKLETNAPPSLGNAQEINAFFEERLFVGSSPSEGSSALDWLNWGNQLWRIGKNQEAIQAFKKAIAIEPNFYQAYYALGSALDKQEAIAAYDRAVQIQPNFYEAWRKKGEVLQQMKQFPQALTSIEKALELNPGDATLHLLHAQILMSLERYREAQNAATEAIKLKPNYLSYVVRGNTQTSLLNFSGAIADYSKAIEINPNDIISYMFRGMAYSAIQETQMALADFNQVEKLIPDNNPYSIIISPFRGFARLQFGDYPGALADFNKILNSNAVANLSTSPELLLMRGFAYLGMGELEKALADINRSLENPDNSKNSLGTIYSFRSIVYLNQGDLEKASIDLQKAVELQPENPGVYNIRSAYRFLTQDYQGAMADAKVAIKLQPNFADTYALQGASLIMLGKVEQGFAELDTALTKNPKSIFAINLKAQIHFERGETEKAIKLWQKAVEINQSPAYQLALATALYSKGETKQGLELAKKALETNKNLIQINKFKSIFWGDRLSANTQKLLDNIK